MSLQQFDEYAGSETERESLWKRALIMIGFMIALGIAQALVHLIAILQFVTLALNKTPSTAFATFGGSLALWLHQIAAYQTMATDEKPFPWQSWPDLAPMDDEDAPA